MPNVELNQWIENATNFTQVEDTLVIRYGNALSQEYFDTVFSESFNVWWHKIHSVHLLKEVLVIWNLGEIAVPLPESSRQVIKDSVKKYIGDLPITFIVPTISKRHDDEIAIEPFEILSQLLYDMHPDVHNYRKWKPHTQKCLYLVGKLRAHRYYFLKHLIEHLPPEQFQYVLNRRTFNGVVWDDDPEVIFENWVDHVSRNFEDILTRKEISDFLAENETPVYDNVDFKMLDRSQMISDRMMRETSLSLIAETSDWANKFISEKTYLCIATGRPFILYHSPFGNAHLESRGYKLYADYDKNQVWHLHNEECTQEHLEYYTNSVKNFLATCKENREEIFNTILFNQRKLRRNTDADLYKVGEVFPAFNTFTTQQKLYMLLASTEDKQFYK